MATEYQDLTIKFGADVSALKSAMTDAKDSAGSLQTALDAIKSKGEQLTSVGTALTVGVTTPLVALGTKSLSTAVDFDNSMQQVQGALGDASADMEELTQLALDMGNSTVFSAAEAAEAMVELAKGGLTDADIQGGSLAATMDLAAAGSLSLADAANATVQAMGTFGLSASDSTRIANSLAGAANASSADVSDLTQALRQGGLAASNAGMSIEETTAVLAAFADAGLNGSDAGTSLKTMLSALQAPTSTAAAAMESYGIEVNDASGSMLSISDIAQQLQDKLGSLTQAERNQALATIFGSDAMRAATVLMTDGAEGLERYMEATNDASSASTMAAAQLGDTGRALEEMSGALETAQIALGTALAPAVTSVANTIADLAGAFSNLDDDTQSTIVTFAALAAAIGPVMTIGGKLITTVTSLIERGKTVAATIATAKAAVVASTAAATANATATTAMGVAQQVQAKAASAARVAQLALNTAMRANPVGTVLTAVGLLAGALVTLTSALSGAGDETEELTTASRKQAEAVKDAQAAYDAAVEAHGEMSDEAAKAKAALEEETAAYESSKETLDEYESRIDSLIESHSSLMDSISSTYSEATSEAGAIELLAERVISLSELEDKSTSDKAKLQATVESLNDACEGLNLTYDEQADSLNLTADAVKSLTQAQADSTRASAAMSNYNKLIEEQINLEAELQDAQDGFNNTLSFSNATFMDASGSIRETIDAHNAYEAAIDDVSEALEDNKAAQAAALEIAAKYTSRESALAQAVEAVRDGTMDATEAAEAYGAATELGITADEVAAQAALEEAEALAEEQAVLSEAAEAVEEYASTNKYFAQVLVDSGLSVEEFAACLDDAGLSMEDYANAIEDGAARASSAFSSMSWDMDNSAAAAVQGLQDNIEVMQAWSTNVEALASNTGIHFNDAFLTAISDSNAPEEMGLLLQQMVDAAAQGEDALVDGTDMTVQQIIDLYGEAGDAGSAAYTGTLMAGVDSAAAAGAALADATNAELEAGVDVAAANADSTASIYVSTVDSYEGAAADAGGALKSAVDAATADDGTALAAGTAQGEGFAAGIGSAQSDTQASAQSLADAATAATSNSSSAYSWGSELGGNFAAGISSAWQSVKSAAYSLASAVSDLLHFSEPEEGPLKGFNQSGYELGANLAAGMLAEVPTVKAAALDLAAAASLAGEVDANWRASSASVQAVASVKEVPMGDTNNININGLTFNDDEQITNDVLALLNDLRRRGAM